LLEERVLGAGFHGQSGHVLERQADALELRDDRPHDVRI
jgi:hypothetical protein